MRRFTSEMHTYVNVNFSSVIRQIVYRFIGMLKKFSQLICSKHFRVDVQMEGGGLIGVQNYIITYNIGVIKISLHNGCTSSSK